MMEQILRDLLQTINNMQWSDYLDIVVVALLIYKLLPLVRTPHTMRLARTAMPRLANRSAASSQSCPVRKDTVAA